MTISGPPRILKTFLENAPSKLYNLPIETPYHAPHIFRPRIDDLIAPFHDDALESYKLRIPFISPSSGMVVEVQSFRDLLREAISGTLCAQIRWDKIMEALPKEVIQQKKAAKCTLYSLSSNNCQILSSAMRTGTSIEVLNLANNATCSSAQSKPTGKFEHSKIAIVGYSGRFPECASNEEFWAMLRAGRDVHRTIPEDRFDWKTHYDPTGKTKNTSRIKYGCFIKEPGLFDTRFFNMSPREAENTDPAQRLAITVTQEALEMAGMVPNRTPSSQQDRIGVFFGVTSDDWREVNSGQNVDTYFIPGGNRAFVPGRIR